MEALRVFGTGVVFALIFASVVTLIVSLVMDPLERARQRYVERERSRVKALRA